MAYADFRKNTDFEAIKEVTDNLEKGGYICKILKVEDYFKNGVDIDCLKVYFDIEDGIFKGHFKEKHEWLKGFNEEAQYPGVFYLSYKSEFGQSRLKKFEKNLEKSNKTFDIDKKNNAKFKNMLIGLVFSEEEYVNQQGVKKIKLYNSDMVSVEDIKKNNFKLKELKKLSVEDKKRLSVTEEDFEEIDLNEDEAPF